MAEENGKISWYDAIKESLSVIKDDIREIKDAQKIQAEKLNDLCVSIGQHETAIKTNHDEIEKLRAGTNLKESLIGAGSFIALVLSALGINK